MKPRIVNAVDDVAGIIYVTVVLAAVVHGGVAYNTVIHASVVYSAVVHANLLILLLSGPVPAIFPLNRDDF